MGQRKLRLRAVILIICVVLLLVVIGGNLLLGLVGGRNLQGLEVYLLVGTDKRPEEQQFRSDTIILAICDWQQESVQLVSVPRDSYVQLPERGTAKINEAYFYGGIELLQETLAANLGVTVDHYVDLDFAGFVALVDAFGGVELEVAHTMYKPEENIDLQQGLQVLNGTQALGFVRYRDLPMGDIDRIANQQKFLQALRQQTSALSFLQAPRLAAIALEYCESDCSLTELAALGSKLARMSAEQMQFHSLPGTPQDINGRSYWVLQRQGVADTLAQASQGQLGGNVSLPE